MKKQDIDIKLITTRRYRKTSKGVECKHIERKSLSIEESDKEVEQWWLTENISDAE